MPGKSSPVGAPVAGSSAKPGAAIGVITMRTAEKMVAPTTAAPASVGQRSFWKYVSTATAMARTPAAMKYRIGVLPAPG